MQAGQGPKSQGLMSQETDRLAMQRMCFSPALLCWLEDELHGARRQLPLLMRALQQSRSYSQKPRQRSLWLK